MSQEFNVRIKGKIDTQTNFEASQEIYLDGELLTVRMTDGSTRFKVGDGVSTFSQLKYTDENLVDLINGLEEKFPDVSEFVIASDEGEISSEIPTTFNGYTVEEFVLKTEVVDNLDSTQANVPLSANQGKILNDKITSNDTSILSLENNISSLNSSKLDKNGGTLTGILTASSNTSYTTKQVRNIFLSTSEPVSSSGSNGDIWIIYEG